MKAAALGLTILLNLVSAADVEISKQLLDANRRFSAEVYTEALAQNKNENFLVCPFSAETVLALTLNGAKDETAEEIKAALHFPDVTAETNRVFENLLTTVKSSDSYKLQMANKIYVKQNFSIKGSFRQAAKAYQMGLQNVDFAERKKAAKTINKWVSKQTGHKIKNLVLSESLNKDTAALLVNALYFQGNWRKVFKKTLTKERDFHKTPTETVQVETMKASGYYPYYENENAAFLQIPFRNSPNVSMVFALPKARDGLARLEAAISDVYDVSDFKWVLVKVALPKFTVESSVDFKAILKNLGVKRAFNRADFSGIAGEKGEIYISDVVQKAFLSVNEEGVEAAATTAVIFHPKSLIDSFGTYKTFTADHPFLFYIKIHEVIIFTGRFVSP